MKKEIKFVLFIGLLFSLIIGLPHLYMIHKNSYNLYEPLSLKNVNPLTLDENLYSSGVQDVMNGNLKLSNSQLKNRSHIPSTQVTLYLPFYTLGFLGSILGKSIKNLHIISDFLFTFIIFILFYILLGKLNFVRSFRFLITAVIMLIGLNPIGILQLMTSLFSGDIIRPIEYSRFSSPQFIFILLISLIVLYRALQKHDIKYFVLSGILGGLLFYTNFYFATFFWSGILFMIILSFLKRNYNLSKKLIITSFTGIVISMFFIINILKFRALPYYKEFILKTGAEFPPIFSFWHMVFTAIILITIIIIQLMPKRKGDYSIWFLTSFLLGSIICINMHVFLGYTMLYFHWWERIVAPFVFISFMLFLQYIVCNKLSTNLRRFTFKKIIPFLLIVVLFLGIYTQVSFSINKYNDYKTTPEEIELYKWLNKNTPKDSAVLTLSIASNFNLASHTHNNIYIPHSFLTSIPSEEIIDRFLFVASKFNLSEEDILKRLDSNNLLLEEYNKRVYELKETSQELFEISFFNYYLFHEEHFYHHYKLDYLPEELPKDYFGYYLPHPLREVIMNKYKEKDFKVYEYDYILVGPYEKNFDYNLNNLEVVFTNKGYSLYKE